MKNKWHDIIRKRLVENRKECRDCISPENDFTWGTTRKNKKRTVALLNTLLKNIPKDAWPKNDYDYDSFEYRIASNNWLLRLFQIEGHRHADLIYKNDDHTAWVRERDGKFVDFDIGGS